MKELVVPRKQHFFDHIPKALKARYDFLGLGSTGAVYQISTKIVVKYRIQTEDADERWENELKIYDVIEKYPSPYITRSFLRTVNANFLEYAGTGNLYGRIRSHEIRDVEGKVVGVSEKESRDVVVKWVKDLSGAAAWLESIGLVHDDLRPFNIMLQPDEHLKIIDFDYAGFPGGSTAGAEAPYGIPMTTLDDHDSHPFSTLGIPTMLFATGTNFYFMTRGFEPYEDEIGYRDGPEVVDRFIARQYPVLDMADDIDRLIHDCWHFKFATVGDLFEATKALPGDDSPPQGLSDQEVVELRQQCETLVAEGLLCVEEAEDDRQSQPLNGNANANAEDTASLAAHTHEHHPIPEETTDHAALTDKRYNTAEDTASHTALTNE